MKGCLVESWAGDGACDDGNNNAGCDYDGGDCCGPFVDTTFCSICECLDPNAQQPSGKIKEFKLVVSHFAIFYHPCVRMFG